MMTMALESLALEAPDVSFVHSFPGLVRTKLGQDTKSAGITVLRAVFKVVGPLVTIPVSEAGERQLFMATSARFPARAGVDVDETAGVGLGFGLGAGAAGFSAAMNAQNHTSNNNDLNGFNNINTNSNSNSRPSIEIRNTDSGTVLTSATATNSSSISNTSNTTSSSSNSNRDSNSSVRNSHSSHSTTNSSTMNMNLRVAKGTDGREGSGVYSVSNDGEGLSSKTEEILRQMREEQDMVRKVWLHVEDEFVRVTGSAFVA